MRDEMDDDILELSDTVQIHAKAPFYVTANEFEELEKLLEEAMKNIKSIDNPRTIILETWLVLDYCVRNLIAGALDMTKHSFDDLDLRYELLPHGFRSCLDILEKIINKQKGLERPPEDNRITYNGQFLHYIKKSSPDCFDKLLELEQAYYKKYHPELVREEKSLLLTDPSSINNARETLNLPRIEYRSVSDSWFGVIAIIDAEWFKKARKLNDIRNFAAHRFDANDIYQKMGINGANKLELLRSFCLKELEVLFTVSEIK